MDEKRFREKLAGRVRFPEDVSSKNMLYCRAIRSPYPSGNIEEIILPPLPEGCIVLGAEDIPGPNRIQIPQGEMPLLASGKVSYRGEPILLVGAPSLKKLTELLTSISVRITPEPELPPLSLDLRENIAYERTFYRGEAEKILEKIDLLQDEDFYSADSLRPETNLSAQVSCRNEGNRIIIHSVNQWPTMVRKNVASLLKIRRDQVVLRNYPGENSRDAFLWFPILTSCYAALLSRHSRRTVRFILTQDERERILPPRGKVEFYIRGAQTTDGNLLALKVDFVMDAGAYPLLAPELIDRMVLASSGLYHCRHLEISGRAIKTNQPPTGPSPDFNMAPVFFALESFSDNMARSCGISPIQWKRMNLVKRGTLFMGGSLAPVGMDMVRLMDRIGEISDFNRKESSYQLLLEQKRSISSNNESFQRGMALSLAYIGNDFLYNHVDLTTLSVRATLDKKGEVKIYLPLLPGTDKIKKSWALRASAILGLDDTALVSFHFDQKRINGGPSAAGRNITHITRLVELCCEQIQKKRFRDPLPISVTRRYSRQVSRWDREAMTGTPFYNLSYGGAAVEVEIDQETFKLTIRKVWFVLDCGLVADEASARTTVERGLYQSMESLFGDRWFEFHDFPRFDVEFISAGNQCRGLDGLVQSLFPPALACAVNQALGMKGYTLPLHDGIQGG